MWSPASSRQEEVLPPSTSRFSISSTSMPASSSLTAVANPASPPPTMIVFGIALCQIPVRLRQHGTLSLLWVVFRLGGAKNDPQGIEHNQLAKALTFSSVFRFFA